MKNVLVTGAAGGMGRAVMERFARGGWRVFAADRIAVEPRENVTPLQMDVTDEASVSAAVAAVSAETESLDLIVHLAGIYALDSLLEMPPADFERVFRVNLGGAFLVNRTFQPLLQAGARVILVTSELAVRDPLPFTGVYAVAKAALDRYAYSLRMEWQLLGVTVSVLRAGAVDTGMLGDSTRSLDAFCENTSLYACNAKRFRNIVDRVEARKVPPAKVAAKLYAIAQKSHPRFAYALNRNPLLILFDTLPKPLRFTLIRRLLR